MTARGFELDIGGIFVSSFVGYAVAALLLLLVIRPLLFRIGFARAFANPPLAEAAVFVCLLGLLVLIL